MLNRHRQSGGFGPSALSLSDIAAVAGPLGFRTANEFIFFAEVIGDMDDEFLTFVSEKRKAEAAAKPKSKRIGPK